MSDRIINVVAAVIRDDVRRMLLVRKRGTSAFMQPGGKPAAGEDNLTALQRELLEELGCRVDPGSVQSLGVFECAAANEPGFRVRAAVYSVDVDGAIEAQAEIDEVLWVDPRALPDLPLAPLTRDHIMPLARLS
jgi:8-oxo-dGTP diphosphatase